jgi:flagellar biogenesis protein FliO
MRKAIATAAILFVLMALCPSSPTIGQDNGRGATDVASDSASPASGDRGAGYLPYADPAPFGSGSLLGAIARIIFSLALVLGLLYATLWAIKRFSGGMAGPTTGGAVHLVGRIYLSPKIVVYFLKLADELLVIGTNAGNISLLTSVTDEDAIHRIESDLKGGRAGAGAPGFPRLFDRSLANFQKSMEGEHSMFEDQLRTLNDQIGRLKGLARRKRSDEE